MRLTEHLGEHSCFSPNLIRTSKWESINQDEILVGFMKDNPDRALRRSQCCWAANQGRIGLEKGLGRLENKHPQEDGEKQIRNSSYRWRALRSAIAWGIGGGSG
ncbi:uncharacterized protein LOC117191737 isoform X1 [Drosophila miranda]|uniref:uncharacterized protein LOC117191737 isoform X1 n=1 Tax=Drosophila miranda TaxID=7229 RepID=UPI00143F1869|nr:uncharacterized protein LOC117191737 isoform X1 [Drosophila miranda]